MHKLVLKGSLIYQKVNIKFQQLNVRIESIHGKFPIKILKNEKKLLRKLLYIKNSILKLFARLKYKKLQ